MTKNPNAFPTSDITSRHPGMTQRDWFAGQALNGLTTDCNLPPNDMAVIAYKIADAMLAERAK